MTDTTDRKPLTRGEKIFIVLLCAFIIAAMFLFDFSAYGQSTLAPFYTSQVNTNIYVNMGAGSPYTTIAKATTKACTSPAAFLVIILPGANPTDSIGGQTGVCNGVILIDYSAAPAVTYKGNGTVYVSQGGGGGCSGPCVTSFNSRTGAVTLSEPDIAGAIGGSPTVGQVLTWNGTAYGPANAAGGITTITGDVNASGSGSVAATVKGLNGVPFCNGFTPTNGQAIEYTTASTPNPCYTAATGGAGGVTSFNTRTGAVTLSAPDVNGVGAITNNTSGNAGTATHLAAVQTGCSGGTPFMAGIGNGAPGSAVCIAGITNPIPPTGSGPTGGAEYLMNEGTGTVVHDNSGNGNDANFGTGGNAPSWYTYGVAFNDGGFVANSLWIDTPFTDFGTVAFNYCTPNMGQTTGTGIGGFPAANFPTIWGSTDPATGLWLISNLEDINAVQPGVWNIALSNIHSQVTGWYGNCHIYIYAIGSPDLITVDGVTPASSSFTTNAPYTASAAGHYRIGYGSVSQNALRGVVTHAIIWPHSTVLNAAQQAQIYTYMRYVQSQRPGFPAYPLPNSSKASTLVVTGTSIDAGYLGNHAWTNDLTTNRTYTVVNNSIGGSTMADNCATAEQRWEQYSVAGDTFLFIDAPTNDMVNQNGVPGANAAWTAISLCAQKAHSLGMRIYTATMIDRNGLGGTDADKNNYNPIVRARWKGIFDGLIDLAEFPGLGADGASGNTNCYNADQTHLVNSTGIGGSCGTIGTTALSGYGAYAYLLSGIVNAADGSTAANPNKTASNAYTETYADGFLIQTPTAAATNTLVDCQGIAAPRTIINGSGSFAITVSDPTSHSFVGSNVVASGATAVFQSIPGALSTGGCSWLRTQ